MDAEFINMFVQKQKDSMIEFLLQKVMLETRIALAESHLQKNEEEIQRLKIIETQFNEQTEELKLLQQENLNLRKLRNT